MGGRKKLLVYAHYYAPDVASTAQIYTELTEGLRARFDVTVICAVPSYSGSVGAAYRAKPVYGETLNGVRLLRVRVPAFSKADKRSRIRNIMAYFWGAMRATRRAGRQDVVFAASQPPILSGLLGVWGKWIARGKLIYNIQDFNPEQIMAVNYSANKPVLKWLMALDKFSCRRSDLIITVGRDMRRTLEGRFAGQKAPGNIVVNNWIDEKAVYPLPKDHPAVAAFRAQYGLTDKFVVMYSGNIGLYYDLRNLVKLYGAYRDRADVAFAFVGDGAVKGEIEAYCRENGLRNVAFIPYQDKEKLIYSLNAADVHIVNNAKGIAGVSVPSKIYGVLAVNVPILGILERETEAWRIIEDSGCGILAEAGDYGGIRAALHQVLTEKEAFVKAHATGRAYLMARFTREKSLEAYARAIEGLCEGD